MRINGRAIAEKIYEDLKPRIGRLKDRGISPTLAVILVGDDPASKTYVAQKEKWGEKIGVHVAVDVYKPDVTTGELVENIHSLNMQKNIDGIIIQRPLPPHIDGELLTNETSPTKDVDGFHSDSPFDPPVALAVEKLLKFVYDKKKHPEGVTFSDWIHTQRIAILGKGETAGRPIQKLLTKRNLFPIVINSKTTNPQQIMRNADIIISAVGKPEMVTKEAIKNGAIVIGVGMHQGEDGKLHGDYNATDIARIASAYTPVPGGVGPVNVAMLLSNVVDANENQSDKNARVISATF